MRVLGFLLWAGGLGCIGFGAAIEF